jgi:hypothetical protein
MPRRSASVAELAAAVEHATTAATATATTTTAAAAPGGGGGGAAEEEEEEEEEEAQAAPEEEAGEEDWVPRGAILAALKRARPLYPDAKLAVMYGLVDPNAAGRATQAQLKVTWRRRGAKIDPLFLCCLHSYVHIWEGGVGEGGRGLNGGTRPFSRFQGGLRGGRLVR